MMELRNKGKNITGTASPENGQKGSPQFSKFFMPDSDVTAVKRLFRFLHAVLFRHLLELHAVFSAICFTHWKMHPQRDTSAIFAALLLFTDFHFVKAKH
jgi:hypothetical protein